MPAPIFHIPPAKFRPGFIALRLAPVLAAIWLGSPAAMAQTSPTTGTITPLATNAATIVNPDAPNGTDHKKNHHKRDSAHDKHDGKHHKDRKKHPLLPVSDEFSTLSQADAHCPAGTVEWASMGDSSLYHNSQSRYFGKTKHGVYACKAALDAAGFRAGR